MGKLNLTIQSSRTQERRVEDVRSIGSGNDLDHIIGSKSIQLTQQLKHGTLHLSVTRLIPPESLRTNGIQLVNEYDGSAVGTIGYFLLGEFKRVTDEFGTVTDEHLHELRTSQLQKDSVGLVGAGTCE